ncbi:hypothetical protein JOF59_006069 [Streptomyces clavifer]|uniref:Uncharacterized protein n=1 Tax=Streptomyces clavifer TaxID=68188 RepID=A0ABS4VI14_9ACTN|nr:hypothetical protein [Streptomyces clavifer]
MVPSLWSSQHLLGVPPAFAAAVPGPDRLRPTNSRIPQLRRCYQASS